MSMGSRMEDRDYADNYGGCRTTTAALLRKAEEPDNPQGNREDAEHAQQELRRRGVSEKKISDASVGKK